jgi:ribosomal protein S18 acetylase RimI-like enzyme
MSNVEIKVLTREDWSTYKVLRLSSLRDSPDSFGSTFEQESNLTDLEWASRLEPSVKTKHLIPFVATHNGVPAGLAFVLVHGENDKTACIYQMWVSSSERGQGIGKSLMSNIISWAKKSNLQNILLSVTTTNTPAISLYTSVGFKSCSELEILREGSSLFTQSMNLQLPRVAN